LNFYAKIGDLELRSPLLLASGTWGLGEKEISGLEYISALITKGVSKDPMPGNPPPRLAEAPCGLINSIGLENPGVETFLKEYLPRIKKLGPKVIVNLHGESIEDFCYLAERFENADVSGIEINISCPNVRKGGIHFSESAKDVFELVNEVRKRFTKLLIVKLSPRSNVFDIAFACEEAGANALTVANTYPALAVVSLKPFKVLLGGLSGPAIKPLTLRLVYELSQKVKLPIIASGGVMTGRDVVEYLACGATAVQVGTALLIDPLGIKKIYKEFEELYQELEWGS
jgi:dihydroorotate dehydrogenase (NAD+) catalytic subunit